jgi:peptidoglycan-associated lipoprotein
MGSQVKITKMKRSNLLSAVTFGLTLALAVSGCKHKSPNTTPIPGSSAPSSGNTGNNLPPGNPLPPEAPPSVQANPSGIPQSANGLWNGPHKEDREKFAADTVYFDFDSATIKSTEESKLQDVANYFKSNTTDALTVEGNCDERGTEKYNLSLGERRALAVREYLAQLGVDPARIHTVTYGAAKPVDTGHNEAAWKKNRRDDMVLLQPQ